MEIAEGSVIYADPPYATSTKTGKDYGTAFDHAAFYDWCEAQTQPLYISEYTMSEERFVCVAEWNVVSSKSSTNNACKRVEKLWMPRGQLLPR